MATLAAVPELVAAGVTDVTVNLAAFAPTLADAPAGLAIGAQGPAESALSTAAGVIRTFRG